MAQNRCVIPNIIINCRENVEGTNKTGRAEAIENIKEKTIFQNLKA